MQSAGPCHRSERDDRREIVYLDTVGTVLPGRVADREQPALVAVLIPGEVGAARAGDALGLAVRRAGHVVHRPGVLRPRYVAAAGGEAGSHRLARGHRAGCGGAGRAAGRVDCA